MIRRAVCLLLCLLTAAACTTPGRAEPRASAPAPAPALPDGQKGGWRPAFHDEFDGDRLDPSRWADHSSAEPDEGRGNLGNQQLEWNRAANCRVGGGELVMTARRETVTSPSSGQRYDWTSCLITSTPAYAFQYGYLEERAILPAARGFWPAFWTWQARGVDRHTETDAYEFYSDNHRRLYGTQFSGERGRCEWRPAFDPTAGWHTYGVAIEPSGTTWYADGRQVCHSDATSDAPTAIISNLAVYSRIPPEPATTSAVKRVDYIRAWTAS
ncbi:glycoside hydrolase family 16 protein [Nucisporomicrobium flavum]|uniref:glycoside hydrolase family 16 protein n=1 Tax=Nucisporomicrobium flavum TaxID=2785915 RepID=UPI003C2E4044